MGKYEELLNMADRATKGGGTARYVEQTNNNANPGQASPWSEAPQSGQNSKYDELLRMGYQATNGTGAAFERGDDGQMYIRNPMYNEQRRELWELRNKPLTTPEEYAKRMMLDQGQIMPKVETDYAERLAELRGENGTAAPEQVGKVNIGEARSVVDPEAYRSWVDRLTGKVSDAYDWMQGRAQVQNERRAALDELNRMEAQGFTPASQQYQMYARQHGITADEAHAALDLDALNDEWMRLESDLASGVYPDGSEEARAADARRRELMNLIDIAEAAQPQEDLSTAQQMIDRVLGDRTQITGEETDWRKLLKGILYKGADQFSTGIANTLDFLGGDFAEELHILGVESLNQAIDALNHIPGVNLEYVENNGNFLSRWAESLRGAQQQNQEYFAANANSSRIAQIIDKFGTSTVAAIPMALEALILSPAAAAQGAGAEMTTAGLQYTSALAQSSGLSEISQIGMQGLRNLMKDPQFWTSYLQVMGDGYQDALDQGMSGFDAALYAMVNGFFNAMIEIGGVDDDLGGINRLPRQLREALESGNVGTVVSIAKSMFGEGWEEVEQGVMERGLIQAAQGEGVGDMFSLDPSDTHAAFNPFSAADEFAGGAVVGGLLGGGQSAITAGLNRVASWAAQKQTAEAVTDSGTGTAPVSDEETAHVVDFVRGLTGEPALPAAEEVPDTGTGTPAVRAEQVGKNTSYAELKSLVDGGADGLRIMELDWRHKREGSRKRERKMEPRGAGTVLDMNDRYVTVLFDNDPDGLYDVISADNFERGKYAILSAADVSDSGTGTAARMTAEESGSPRASTPTMRAEEVTDSGTGAAPAAAEEAGSAPEAAQEEPVSQDEETRLAMETVQAIADFASGKSDALPEGVKDMTRDEAEGEIVELGRQLGVEPEAQDTADDFLARSIERVQNYASAVQESIRTKEAQAQQRTEIIGRALSRAFGTETELTEEEKKALSDAFMSGPEMKLNQYATGVRTAYRAGLSGVSLEQALSAAGDRRGLSAAQFRTAWKIGHAHSGSDYASIEDFAAQYPSPDSVTEIFNMDEGMDLYDFTVGFRAAYDMGRSGVSEAHVTEDTAPYLTKQQRKAAYELGQEAADKKAQKRSDKIDEIRKTGKLERKKGTVRGVGVTIAELRKKFNDPQRIAYRFLSRFAELTGVDIVLYESETDEHGNFAATQGEFRWKDDTIYIDINSGLFSSGDVNELGKYTMLRTFSHEFTHFIEKWNAKGYNEFRKFVFSTMEKQGVNVNDLIETKMSELNMSEDEYEQASREVVADSMMDILTDSRLVQNLAEEHPNIFKTLLRKLKQFVGSLKQYYKGISTRIPEAELLKKSGAYLDEIVRMWDDIAKTAVENYQSANGQEQTEPETRRVGMDFFRNVEETGEEAPNLRQMAAKNNRPVGRDRFPANDLTSQAENGPDLRSMAQQAPAASRDRFPANDFTSQAEAGPDLKSMVPRAESAPSETQETQAAEREAETPAATETPAQEESVPQDTTEGARLRARLDAENVVDFNGFRYEIFGMKSTTVNIRNGGVTTGAEYRGTIREVSGGPVSVANGRAIFDRTFDNRAEAVDYMVAVAENNHLLEKAPARKGSADAFSKGDIFSEKQVKKAAETPAARKIIEKMPKGAETNGTEETAEAAAASVGAETDADRYGDGAVRVPAELQTGDVQRDAAGREPAAVPAGERLGSGRDDNRPDAKRNGRSRSQGTGESGVQPGRSGSRDSGRGTDAVSEQEAAAPMTEEEQERQREALHETTTQQVEQKSTESAGGNNYQIGESLDLPNGSKARFRANVDAIRLVKQLESEGRNATAEEQAVLARYVGWGGIPEAFDERKGEWSKEYAELKELLTDEEYKAAKGSTLNAHYTSIPVIRAMYRGLEKLGFKGGRMLEPSSGVGNFVGAMPASMTGNVRSWTMVELDNITGLIAKHLYPQNDVRIEGFEKTILPDNYMDVAIGNVPFGNYPVVDRAYPKKLTSAIHNYFFAKSLDKVRPGGIVMFITSSYTMNANDRTVRNYISKKADLLGAIRLPNTAFAGNAGTSVVTDILVLKKRAPGTEYAGVPFVETQYDYKFGYQNEYFKAHPDMVLGEEVTTRGMHYRDEYSVNPYTDRGSLEEQIDKAFQQITGHMDYPAQLSPEKTNYRVQRAEKGTKQGGYVQREGKLYQNDGGELREVQTDEKTAKRITGMLGIRDAARELMNAQLQGVNEKSIKALRRSLNKAYDAFVAEYGFLNSPANRKAFQGDPDRFSLYALENWDAEKKTATKADIFSTDTIKPNQTITHADTVKDALAICRNTIGSIDVQVIAQLTGRTQEDVTRELIDSELAFKTTDGQLEPAETYLSGNVRAKLRDAQGLVGIDRDYQHNIDALKAVVPADIPHEQIFVQPGTPWIPESVYSDFAAFILGGNNHRYYGGPDIAVHRSNQTGTFTIDLNNKRLKTNYQNMQEWGTPKRSFLNLLEAMMNSRSVTVTYKDSEGHTIVDRVATDAANEKIEQITKKFQEWLWQDEERTRDLEYLYNETFNNLVTPKYDGGTLTVNGLRAGWSLRPHQADAVQRIVSSGGNTLLAHRVGAGKTLKMAAAAMKLKELGIVQKPMFAVPKSLVAQWGKEFSSYFPAAKLLVAEQSDFTPANRKTFANRIATGNYDAIIVSYEQFEKIPISDSFALQLYQEQVDEIIQAINEAKEEAGAKSMSVKDMEKKRKQLEAKIKKLSDKAKDSDSIEFEQLGIDSIFIDEAHNFKNLFYTTSMNNVSGLGNKDGSKRAFDLYTKVRYLQQLNGGRGVVFATATPVMNSMSEMYIMQKYLQSDLLDQLGLSTFDAWAKQFGEVVNGVEIKPSGQGYRVKQSFSRFKNMNELQLLFRNFADVLTKVPGLKIPKMKGGAVKVVECDAGEFQQEYMKQLEKRADNIKNVDPSEDNMLKITSDGRKISYTQRMIDPSLPYEEGSKLYKCAENIVEEYKASRDVKGTQIVFCDMATPKGRSNNANAAAEEDAGMDTESAKLYDDLKKRLVKLGIPAREIAFIHDADTDAKKSKLFDDMNAGRVRVLIGSTGKMGVGMNAQKRAVAIHHLDAPWRPGDVEQRDGRVFRQGNINEEVSKYVYVTTGSFDARLWDIIDRKSSFIDQIMNGENVGREVEDTGEVTLSAAEVKALASGSPLILEQVQLETDIKKLQNLYMAHRQSAVEAGKKLQEAKQAKAEAETRAANARKDIKHRTEASTDEKFSITVGNKAYTDKKEAGKVLMAHAAAKATEETYTKIGSFAGFDVMVMQTKEGIIGLLKADGAYRFNTYPDNTTLMITNMQKVLNGLDNAVQAQEELARQKAQEIKAQEAMMRSPFPRQAELDQKRQRYNEVMEELNPKEEQAIDSDADEDEDRTEYSYRGKDPETGRSIYQGNFPKKTPKRAKAAVILHYIQNVWSKKPIRLTINNSDGSTRTIYAKFDPTYDETGNTISDASKLMGGNRHGTGSDKRVTLDLAQDYYQIAEESRYNYSKKETGKNLVTHDNVKEWHYFIDDILFQEYGEEETAPYRVTINVKEREDGSFIYSYNAEKQEIEPSTRRTLHADVNQSENGEANAQLYDTSIAPNGAVVNTEVENSTRRQTFSDREILEMATESLDVGTLTPAERTALDIFKNSLDALRQAQEKRASLGQQYRDEQFTKGGSRAEAEKIHAQMKVLDQSIPQMETRLLELQNKDALKKILVKAREAVETIEKEEGKQKLRQYREQRNESAAVRKYRARVQADVMTLRNWLVNPSSKDIRQHVPAELQKTVADFLESINLMSKTFLNSSGAETTKADQRYLKSMQRLRDAIKKNVDSKGLYSGYADLPEDFMEIFDGLIRRVQDHIDQHTGTFVVNQMTAGELRELSNTLRTLRQYISNMNQFHNNAMFRHAYEAGEETIEHLSKLQKSKKGSRAYKFMRFDYMRPSYVFEHFGKGGQSIEHEFREGQAQQAFLANTIIDFAKETYSGREVKAWGEESRSFELENGETVTLPITHIMSLYCLTKRKQAQTHIYGDGIRVANYKEGRKVQLDEGHLVTQADVEKITGSLTDRQKQVADALQHFMSTVSSGWGNYVSMIRFGVEQFTEENYFPINSDGRYLSETADESPDNAGLYALLNSSFTKELRENAKNRIILYNVFDVFANHTASMAQYRSFALPVLDALKWFNYQNDNTSVRTKLSSAFGAAEDQRAGSGSKGYAEQFVINLLKSYNGTSAQGDPYDSMGLKGLHKFNRAQIAYNTRVVIQQPMAVTRAAMILSPAKLAEGLGMSAVNLRKLAAEMEEHSGIAAWKALGFYDTNISRGLTELIKQNQSWDEKFVEFGTKGAELADRFTWAAMWYAAKQSVDRSRYETDAEYMKAVTELFEEVIYKTQVVDSVLTKSEFMRAKGFFPRMLGSFMSEPMTTISMLTDAYYKYTDDLQRGMSRGQAWRRNGKNIAKTVAVYSIGQIMLAAMQAVIDGWRDDDEYDVENPFKNFLMKYLNAFKSNAIEEVLPFGKIPLVSEIYDGLKGLLDYTGLFDQLGLDLYGNGLSNGWAQYAKYLQKGFEISWDLINGNQTNYTAYGAAYNLLRGTSGMVGLPIATLMREVVDVWNNTAGWYAPDKKLVSYQRSTDRKYLEHVRPAGISLKTYERILTEADAAGDGLGSTSQDELGQYLIDLINAGEITQAQAAAIWDSRGWKTSFDKWRTDASEAAAAAEDKSRRIAAAGLTEDRYETIMTAANTDGKGNSPNQGELGTYLLAGIRSGTLSETAAQGIWNTMGWKTSFADWQRKNT